MHQCQNRLLTLIHLQYHQRQFPYLHQEVTLQIHCHYHLLLLQSLRRYLTSRQHHHQRHQRSCRQYHLIEALRRRFLLRYLHLGLLMDLHLSHPPSHRELHQDHYHLRLIMHLYLLH